MITSKPILFKEVFVTYGNYPNWDGIKRILVIKMRHLGDVLLSSPVFTHLQKKAPEALIDALIYKESLPMLEGHPSISRFFLYDRKVKNQGFWKKALSEIALLRDLKKQKYDLVLNLTEGDRGALVALLAGHKYRVGVDPQGSGFFLKKKIYTHLIKPCPTPRHTVEKNLDALRRIGIFPSIEDRGLFLHVPEKACLSVLEKARALPYTYIVIHPVSRWLFKSLDPKQIAELIEKLARHHHIIVSAGTDPQEKAYINTIFSHISSKNNVSNLSGMLSLKELAALIQMSSCLICVDTVALHIASALCTPVVALFGPSSEVGWGPWMNPQARVLAASLPCRPCNLDGCGGSKKSDCLDRISIPSILESVEELLQASCV